MPTVIKGQPTSVEIRERLASEGRRRTATRRSASATAGRTSGS